MDPRDVRRAIVAAAVGAWTAMAIGCASDDCRDDSVSALNGSLELYSEGYAATIGSDEPVSARFYLLGGQTAKEEALETAVTVSRRARDWSTSTWGCGCEDGSCTVSQISAAGSASTSDIVLTIVRRPRRHLRVDAESEPDYDGSTWPASRARAPSLPAP